MGALEVGRLRNGRSRFPAMAVQPGTQWDIKRQPAARLPHKIMKANKGKSGRISNHTGISKRTHTTLPCSCCACAEMSQKTSVLAVKRIDIRIGKALPHVRCGYPSKINCIYSNGLKDICVGVRPALARN